MEKVRSHIAYDKEMCVACYTCEVACKQEHGFPVTTDWIKVVRHPVYVKDNRLARDYSIRRCRHCKDPECMKVCPEEAVYKNADGIVLIREGACSGCGLCVEACPFHAMGFDEEQQVASKCTLCLHLIQKGFQPSCVKHCPSHALEWVPEPF